MTCATCCATSHRLPDDQRAALVLAELGELSHEEIAHRDRVQREKVKALVFQARSSLRPAGAPATRRAPRSAGARDAARRRAAPPAAAPPPARLPRLPRVPPDVQGQRSALALVIPVAPSVALKSSVLSAVIGGGLSAGAGTAGAAGLEHSAEESMPPAAGSPQRRAARAPQAAPAPPRTSLGGAVGAAAGTSVVAGVSSISAAGGVAAVAGGATAAAGGATLAATGAGTLAAKALVVVALAGGSAAGVTGVPPEPVPLTGASTPATTLLAAPSDPFESPGTSGTVGGSPVVGAPVAGGVLPGESRR